MTNFGDCNWNSMIDIQWLTFSVTRRSNMLNYWLSSADSVVLNYSPIHRKARLKSLNAVLVHEMKSQLQKQRKPIYVSVAYQRNVIWLACVSKLKNVVVCRASSSDRDFDSGSWDVLWHTDGMWKSVKERERACHKRTPERRWVLKMQTTRMTERDDWRDD